MLKQTYRRWRSSRCVAAALLLASAGIAVADEAALLSGEGFALDAAELDARLALLPLSERLKVAADAQRLGQFINHQYRLEALYASARAAGIEQRPEVRAQIAAATRNIVVSAYNKRLQEGIELPDLLPLAKLHYAAEKARYKTPEQREARHILLKVGAPEQLPEQRQALAEIKQRIVAGEDFASLAQQFSEDKGSAGQGGLLQPFARGAMVAPFEQAAFALAEPGELSEVVESRFGLHLIQLVAIHPPRQQRFEEVKERLLTQVREEYQRETLDKMRAAITDPAKVHLDEVGLQAFVERTIAATRAEADDIRRAIDAKMAEDAANTATQ